jgi:hypothetical protein
LTVRASVSVMVLWLLSMLLSPGLADFGPSTSELVLGLAAVAAVLLVAVAATRLPILGITVPRTGPTPASRRRSTPRLADPDAAGRPRSRAPAPLSA